MILLLITKKSYAFIVMISFLGLCSMFVEELNLFAVHHDDNKNNKNIDTDNNTPMFVLERIKIESESSVDDPPTSPSSPSSSSSSYAPVIIGAGQGTTGTHLFFKVTCHLGYPSFHFRLGCLPQRAINTEKDDDGDDDVLCYGRHPTTKASSSSQQTPLIDSEEYQKLVKTHISIVKTYKDASSLDAIKFKTTLTTQLESLIVQAKILNITLALHDSPYPMLMPTIIQIVKKHYGDNKLPLILLSERNPTKFVERRIAQHGSQLICKNNNTTTTTINPKTLVGGAFDMITCIENGQQQQQQQQNNNNNKTTKATTTDDFLGRIGDMASHHQIMVGDGGGEDGMNNNHEEVIIAKQFEQYQNAIRNNFAIFSYDMFIQKQRTKPTDLANMIVEEINNGLNSSSGHGHHHNNFFYDYPSMNISKIIDLYKMEYK